MKTFDLMPDPVPSKSLERSHGIRPLNGGRRVAAENRIDGAGKGRPNTRHMKRGGARANTRQMEQENSALSSAAATVC